MRATLKTICAGVVFESGTETNILVRLQNFKAVLVINCMRVHNPLHSRTHGDCHF